jgi:hypothetical protein
MSEQSYIELFESGSISASAFHHADHVRLAFYYLARYSPLEALGRFSTALQRFAQANGKENLYHETITWAYLLLIHERMARCNQPGSWETFAAANPDLLTWKESILHRYYTQATLQSDLAKRVFVFPDKLLHSSL